MHDRHLTVNDTSKDSCTSERKKESKKADFILESSEHADVQEDLESEHPLSSKQ